MSRVFAFLYSVVCYLFFLGIFLYSIGFVHNLLVPRSVDNGLMASTGTALLINALLLGLFAIQHSIMARPWFKNMWTKVVPESVERSTYVLLTCVVMALLFWQWRSMPIDIWLVENAVGKAVLQGLAGIGWFVVLLSTFMISHFDLFGLRQTWLPLVDKEVKPPLFQTTGFYNLVRHPIMLGFIIAFWATPHMTVGHLFFAVMTTGYILVALVFEEKDLVTTLGDDYRAYRRRVSMLVPSLPRKRDTGSSAGDAPTNQTDSSR